MLHPELHNQPTPFTVIAGKYDGDEANCKYIESFATLDEAIVAYDKVSDYQWHYIEYEGLWFTRKILVPAPPWSRSPCPT